MNYLALLVFLYATLSNTVIAQPKYDHTWILNGIDYAGTVLEDDMVLKFLENNEIVFQNSIGIGNNWYPTVLNNPQDGNLAAFTDGCEMRDDNAEVLPDGQILVPENDYYEFTCVTNSIGYIKRETFFLPNPASEDSYYYIYPIKNNTFHVSGLAYTEVTLNMGQPTIGEKLEVVFEYDGVDMLVEFLFEQLAATRHANGRDWWILYPYGIEHKYEVFLLSPEGLNHSHTISFLSPNSFAYYYTDYEFSPLGDYFICSGGDMLQVYAFDRCDGQLTELERFNSHPQVTATGVGTLGYSPDGEKFFIASIDTIYQYRFDTSTTIEDTRAFVGAYDGMTPSGSAATRFGQMALTPDGRLFISGNTNIPYLHSIDNPNGIGTEANLVQRAIELPYPTDVHLPNFPNQKLLSLDGSPCDTLGIDNIYYDEVTDTEYVRPTDLAGLEIYPNPTPNVVQVHLPDLTQRASLEVLDLTGRILDIVPADGQPTVQLDLSDYPAGMYLIQYRTAFGALTHRERVVRQ